MISVGQSFVKQALSFWREDPNEIPIEEEREKREWFTLDLVYSSTLRESDLEVGAREIIDRFRGEEESSGAGMGQRDVQYGFEDRSDAIEAYLKIKQLIDNNPDYNQQTIHLSLIDCTNEPKTDEGWDDYELEILYAEDWGE